VTSVQKETKIQLNENSMKALPMHVIVDDYYLWADRHTVEK